VGRKGEVGKEEVGRRGEVGRREKLWGREGAEKTKNSRQGKMCFCSSPKWFQQPHPQLVHWWLLVHSSLVAPSVRTSSTDFSFENLVFWNLFEFSVAQII
jgi:hypothetical protein